MRLSELWGNLRAYGDYKGLTSTQNCRKQGFHKKLNVTANMDSSSHADVNHGRKYERRVSSALEGSPKNTSSTIDWVVFVGFIVFGMSSWITINGLFAELPQFYNDLPEGPKIYADISVVIQLANIAPLTYAAIRRWCRTGIVKPTYCVLVVGIIAVTATGATWKKAAYIAGEYRSVALLAGVFVCASVDCTTSLLFWPFASWYRASYVTALAVGEGTTGIVASILVWIQTSRGAGQPLLFSVGVYFYSIALLVCASIVAFWLLTTHPRALKERPPSHSLPQPRANAAIQRAVQHRVATLESVDDADVRLLDDYDDSVAEPSNRRHARALDSSTAAKNEVLGFLFLLVWVSLMQNGVKAAVLPYAIPSDTHLLQAVTTAGLCVDPVGAGLALLVRPGVRTHVIVACGWTVLVALLTCLAARGAASTFGIPLGTSQRIAAACSVLSSFFLAFSKSAVLFRLKNISTYTQILDCCETSSMEVHGAEYSDAAHESSSNPDTRGRTARGMGTGRVQATVASERVLFLAGASIQIGSAVGATVLFVLVNFTHCF
eukprot:m.303136 g.303136  ORF g.303136 m.303136 type:complete len:549 (+) comp20159_c0_seq6:346-1992(+)